jgi:hypothetical protein
MVGWRGAYLDPAKRIQQLRGCYYAVNRPVRGEPLGSSKFPGTAVRMPDSRVLGDLRTCKRALQFGTLAAVFQPVMLTSKVMMGLAALAPAPGFC